MTCQESVAIFWDYESCYPAPTASGYDVVNNIRGMGHKFGTVTLLKAYLKLSERPSTRSASLRSELQSSGVSLIDYPGDGPADKMMLVDMFAYAIDNPPSATIVLISMDRGFAYAISVLRLRRYRVVLVAPSAVDVHISLKSQASIVLDCNQNVSRSSMLSSGSFLRCQTGSEDETSTIPASPRDKSLDCHPKSPITTYAPSLSVAPCRTVVGHCRGVFAPGAPQSSVLNTDGSPAKSRKHSPRESTVAGTSKCPERGRAQSSSSINEKFISTARSDGSRHGDNCNDAKHGGQPITPMNPPSWRAHSQQFGDRARDRTMYLQGSRTGFDSVPPAVGRDRQQKPIGENESQVEISSSHETSNNPPIAQASLPGDVNDPLRTVPNVSLTSSHLFQSTSPAVMVSSPVGMPDGQINLTPFLHATTDPTTSFIKSSAASEGGVDTEVASSVLPIALFNPGDQPSRATPSSVDSIRTLNKDGEVTLCPSNNHPTILPSRFRPLVDVLENLRLGGNFLPLRSMVGGQLLTRNKLVYQQAGVICFREYVALAEKAGVVTIGGTAGKAWISLHPAWRRHSLSETSS